MHSVSYICLTYWSDGRVARLSSAKAATAVRIRFGPPDKKESPVNFELAGLFFLKDNKF